jgi:hypothetical protein
MEAMASTASIQPISNNAIEGQYAPQPFIASKSQTYNDLPSTNQGHTKAKASSITADSSQPLQPGQKQQKIQNIQLNKNISNVYVGGQPQAGHNNASIQSL